MESGLHQRTRVKICGITRPEDGQFVARLGADAIGLVFYAKSPRAVSIDQAKEIIQTLPAFVTTVALFKDASVDDIESTLNAVPVDLLQFHGTESPDQCRRYGRPYIKAVGMGRFVDLSRLADQYADAQGLLLDSHKIGGDGGSGKTFDWSTIPDAFRHAILLAGGLNANNVAEAIQKVRPYGVDVSSGVESVPGVKDHEAVAAFISEVKHFDCQFTV